MAELSTTAETPLPRVAERFEAICHSVAVFGAERRDGADGATFVFPFGTARVQAGRERLALSASAADVDGLARLKEILASSVSFHTREEGITVTWRGDLTGSETLRQFRQMTVVSADMITPRMKRIRLSGENLARFGALGGLHVRLLLPETSGPLPDMPEQGADGLPFWPEGAVKPVGRIYTIRRLDVAAGWMDIDFVVHGHGHGVGGCFATSARPGDQIGIIGPLGRPVRSADWYVLGADETGIPALGRILESLPASVQGEAFIEVHDLRERQPLPTASAVNVHWLVREDADGEALARAVLSVAWPDDAACYGWVAAEAHGIELIKKVWRGAGGPGAERSLAAIYWRQGETAQTV